MIFLRCGCTHLNLLFTLSLIQFQDNDFPSLSGGRVVRIATHPDYQGVSLAIVLQSSERVSSVILCTQYVTVT